MSYEISSKPAFDPDSRYSLGYEDSEQEEDNSDPLQSEESQRQLSKLRSMREQAKIGHSINRIEQAIDDDFYDGLQWTDEDKQELQDRGQAPLVFNEIKPAIDWIIGTEKRAKVDWKVHPRTEDDRELAEIKTKLLKYVADVNRVIFSRSEAFDDACKIGIGWLEDGIRNAPGEEPLFSRFESWRNIWLDPLSTAKDISDAMYIIREKFVDLDVSIAMFPKHEEKLKSASIAASMFGDEESDEYFLSSIYYNADKQGYPASRSSVLEDIQASVNNRRERVKLIEHWYKVPETVKVVRVEDYPFSDEYISQLLAIDGEEYSQGNSSIEDALSNGYASLYDAVRLKVRCAIYTDGGTCYLQDVPSPYKHNQFPFTPVWGYRRGRDNAAYGVIRNCRDPQEDLNKRRSKALFILATNKVVADSDAVEDWDELREEAARPDSLIKVKPGRKLELIRDTQLAEEHIMLERANGEYIRHSSGVTAENLGQQTNASSGKAIQARQLQGSVVTAELFDNLRFAIQLQGEKQLSLIEQFYDTPKIVRLVGDRGKLEFQKVNFPEQQDDGNWEITNAITKSKADFIVDEQDFRESMRVAMFEQMMQMLGGLPPEVGLSLLDLVFEMLDVPGKDEIVRRIRKINGQLDPDDPESEEAMAAKAQQEQEQAAINQKSVMLELRNKAAEIAKKEAEANSKGMDTVAKLLEAAEKLLLNPDIAHVADELDKTMSDQHGDMPEVNQ